MLCIDLFTHWIFITIVFIFSFPVLKVEKWTCFWKFKLVMQYNKITVCHSFKNASLILQCFSPFLSPKGLLLRLDSPFVRVSVFSSATPLGPAPIRLVPLISANVPERNEIFYPSSVHWIFSLSWRTLLTWEVWTSILGCSSTPHQSTREENCSKSFVFKVWWPT